MVEGLHHAPGDTLRRRSRGEERRRRLEQLGLAPQLGRQRLEGDLTVQRLMDSGVDRAHR